MIAGGKILELDQPGVQPLGVGLGRGQLVLDPRVGDDLALGGVDEEHPARLQPALLDDGGRVEVEHARLTAEHDQAVGRAPPPAGAQPVAVEHGADDRAVGEADAGRPVPRLHQRRVELVERPPRRLHRLAGSAFSHASGTIISTACGRLRPPRCSSSSTSSKDAESLAASVQIGNSRLQIAGQQVGLEQRLASAHPVAVALDRVDLAVVRDEPERVRQRPRRERVRREAAVHEADRAGEPLVGQVGEELTELIGREHALVDERAAPTATGSRAPGRSPALATRRPCGRRTPVAPAPCPCSPFAPARNSWLKDGHDAGGGRADAARVRRQRRASPGRSGPPRRRSPRRVSHDGARPRRRRPGRNALPTA